ncbi:hypothetical protein [Nocardioides rubriscoriae]|uniref:hypothetical protein n=1 Tax=Nocardioides rubriscoriae TaxID=642762 RepID=UPI0011DFCFBD|nr:hypothetical protein [Nocardioides rubriscoriae]
MATGPVPLRTARGAGRAGRAAGRRDEVAGRFFCGAFEEVFCGVFRAFRGVAPDRACPLLDLVAPVLPAPDLLREDVLELRDPGGEDVRVAMPPT